MRFREKLEDQIAMQTEAGREALQVYRRAIANLTGEQRVAKAFELTELTRQSMRAGLVERHPGATEEEIQEMYVDRLLGCHGLSLAEVRRMQAAQARSRGDVVES